MSVYTTQVFLLENNSSQSTCLAFRELGEVLHKRHEHSNFLNFNSLQWVDIKLSYEYMLVGIFNNLVDGSFSL